VGYTTEFFPYKSTLTILSINRRSVNFWLYFFIEALRQAVHLWARPRHSQPHTTLPHMESNKATRLFRAQRWDLKKYMISSAPPDQRKCALCPGHTQQCPLSAHSLSAHSVAIQLPHSYHCKCVGYLKRVKDTTGDQQKSDRSNSNVTICPFASRPNFYT